MSARDYSGLNPQSHDGGCSGVTDATSTQDAPNLAKAEREANASDMGGVRGAVRGNMRRFGAEDANKGNKNAR